MHNGSAAGDGHDFVAVLVGDLEDGCRPDVDFTETPSDAFAAIGCCDMTLWEGDCDLGVVGEDTATLLGGNGCPAVVLVKISELVGLGSANVGAVVVEIEMDVVNRL